VLIGGPRETLFVQVADRIDLENPLVAAQAKGMTNYQGCGDYDLRWQYHYFEAGGLQWSSVKIVEPHDRHVARDSWMILKLSRVKRMGPYGPSSKL
jgi:hypothetical protein